MNSIFDKSFIEMNILPLTDDFDNEIFSNFGILQLKTKKTEILKKPLFLLFTIDKTGSMDEYVSTQSKQSKMDYVINTMKNIIRFLAKQEVEIYVRIHAFNTVVDVVVDTIKIEKELIEELIDKFQFITPFDSTDIGIALESAQKTISEYRDKFPTHEIGHLFMTDGYATFGELNEVILQNYIDNSIVNIFIGFGKNHNAKMLKKFSEKKNTKYHFVDTIENTELIYGECICQFLYTAIKKMHIVVTGGEIYNWKNNKWMTSYNEGLVIGNSEKTYHIKKTGIADPIIYIYGYVTENNTDSILSLIDVVEVLPNLLDKNGEICQITDLTKYMYRQKVQEILYEANSVEISTVNGIFNRNLKENLKINLKVLFKQIRDYMRLHDKLTDSFLTLLCDDIYTVYKTIGTKHGIMYTNARQTSQGFQETYNTSPINFGVTPLFAKQSGNHDILNEKMCNNITIKQCLFQSLSESEQQDLDEIDYYVPENNNFTCYQNPCILDTIKNLSQQSNNTENILSQV
jgi:hypothetical protein